MNRSTSTLLVLLSTCVSLSAQWLHYPTAGTPRLPNGKPNLAAPAPRTADGKPDFSGLWEVQTGGRGELVYFLDIAKAVKGGLPYKPGVEEMAKTRGAPDNKLTQPITHCLPTGILVEHTVPGSMGGVQKIAQTPGVIFILFEYNMMWRQIYTDGRPLPTDAEPAWNGYSTGKWEGDTLVVETTGFKDGQWLDGSGNPMSDATKTTERFRRPDFGHMQIDITIDDPKSYTRPWTVTIPKTLIPDSDLIEYVCAENEKDVKHMVSPTPSAAK
jgi:hypothetical protein